MNEAITAFDFNSMVLGDEPPLFLLEIALRTVVIYVFTLVLIRWIGSRSIAQLSLVEFLLVIALGSAVGDTMFYPDVPLLHCMIVIAVIVFLDKALSFLVARHPRLEDAIEGKSVELVRDGIIRCGSLEAMNFGHDELFEQLRLKDVKNVAQVEAAYLETNGMLSVFKAPPSGRLGLAIDPPGDVSEPRRVPAGSTAIEFSEFACSQYASVIKADANEPLPNCSHCRGTTWHFAEATPQNLVAT